jgi:hypothetical protein
MGEFLKIKKKMSNMEYALFRLANLPFLHRMPSYGGGENEMATRKNGIKATRS